jgi:transposase
LVEGHPTLEAIAMSLLKVHDVLADEFVRFERRMRAIARDEVTVRRLMTTPGVGVLVALTFWSAIDGPERFRSSRAVGPHFGLTPKKYQSGEIDYSGRISKIGDAGVRTALYEAANVILTKPVRGSDLKNWALSVARRAGPRKARVALARKLAVVLHHMLKDGTEFIPHKLAAVVAA